MAQMDHDRTLTDSLLHCLTQTSAQARYEQWQALTAAFSAEEIVDALANRYASQQEALQRKQQLAEERQTLLNTYLGRELPDEREEASDCVADMDFLRQQVKGYERQFVQLEQQARDAQGMLAGMIAQRDDAQAWNAELTKRYEKSQETLIQLRDQLYETKSQLEKQLYEAQTQLNTAVTQRDESQTWNAELTRLYEQACEAKLQLEKQLDETQRNLQHQADDLREQLMNMTTQWQAATALNTEVMERIDQASQYAAQMAAKVARLDKLPSVRLYNALHRKQ